MQAVIYQRECYHCKLYSFTLSFAVDRDLTNLNLSRRENQCWYRMHSSNGHHCSIDEYEVKTLSDLPKQSNEITKNAMSDFIKTSEKYYNDPFCGGYLFNEEFLVDGHPNDFSPGEKLWREMYAKIRESQKEVVLDAFIIK